MAEASETPKTITFPLFLAASEADWHTESEGGDEINRSNITDESTDGFSIAATLEKVIHGKGSNLNSFIGIHFEFQGAGGSRRFESISITIRFEDEAKPLKDDPEVLSIWPDREYTFQGMTKEIEDTKSIEGALSGGQPGLANGSVTGKWQRQEKFVRDTPARLSGRKTLLKRKAGAHKNAVVVRMSENTQARTGVIPDLRVGILVSRKQAGNHRFKAYFVFKVEADMRFSVVRGLKKLVGANHVTDPVTFDPICNFLDADDVAGINSDLPNAAMVMKYGEAASWTELTNVSKKVKKENGEWIEVDDEASKPSQDLEPATSTA